MSNVLSEEKRQEVLALGRLGWTLRRIEQATGVRRETASQYLKAASVAIRSPRRRSLAKPASEVSTDSPTGDGPHGAAGSSPTTPGRSPRASACEPYRELVESALEKGRNAVAIYQDLVTDHGFAARYASVKRFVAKLRGQRCPEAHPVIVTAPGEEAQVDYGTGPMVRNPRTGKYRRARLFVMTLGYSRKSVRLLTMRSSSRIWAELHERAFRRLGGAVRVVVLDNLKEGVLTPDVYDPKLNPLYRDVLTHYGVIALPCRVRHPDRKGKVESGVGHTKRTPLKGLRFETIEEGQAYLDRWEERWADTRIHGTTKRQVATMFAEEQPSLLALPLEPFRYYEFGRRRVHLDGCVEVEGAYYGAPPGCVGQEMAVQWDKLFVRILDVRTGALLREHVVQKRGRHRIKDEDQPRRTPLATATLLARAERASTAIGTVCQLIYERDRQVGVRRIQGVLSLVKSYGTEAVDDACGAALELGAPTYRFVRRYLERRPSPERVLRQIDPLIRQLRDYRDLVDRMTEQTGE
jgi:transposase